MANCFSKTKYQNNVPNMNQWLIASQLPNVNKVLKPLVNNVCSNG